MANPEKERDMRRRLAELAKDAKLSRVRPGIKHITSHNTPPVSFWKRALARLRKRWKH